MLIEEQPAVRHLQPLGSYFGRPFWTRSADFEESAVYYRPITTWTYALDWARSSGSPAQFHLTNVVLHLVACTLVFALARRAGASAGAAAVASALFGTFPRLTESVTWISGRTDVLAAVAALLALLLYRREPERWLHRVASALVLLAGLLCKEVAAAGFVALAAFEWAAARRDRYGWRRVALNLAPAAAALAAYASLRVWALHHVPASPDLALPLRVRVLSALQALGTYAWMLVDALRPRLQIGMVGRLEPGAALAGVAAAAAIAILGVQGMRRRWPPEVVAGLALAGSGIAMVLHLVPLRVNVIAADRFLYLPAAGIAVALARGSGGLPSRWKRAALAAGLVAIVACGAATFARNADWADEVRLWRVAAQTTPPENVYPAFHLGSALFRRGAFAEALVQFQTAARSESRRERLTATQNLANTYAELGDYDRARATLIALIGEEPSIPLYHYNLGVLEARLLELDAAERELKVALRLFPGYGDAEHALATLRDARRQLEALPREVPGEGTAIIAARAEVDAKLGRTHEAARRWGLVAAAPDCTPGSLAAAATFLVAHGDPVAAAAAVRRLREDGSSSEVVALEGALVLRRARAESGTLP